MRGAGRLLQGLLLGILSFACADPSPQAEPVPKADPSPNVEPMPELAWPASPPVPWIIRGAVLVDAQGQSEMFTIEVPAQQRYLAVRVGPAEGEAQSEALCYRIESVSLDDALLVPAGDALDRRAICTDCVQPVRWSSGRGLFVLSSAADPIEAAGTLRFRVAVRDCALGIPASRARFAQMPRALRIETAWEAQPPADAQAQLAVRVGVGTGSGLDDSTLAALWQAATVHLRSAGIDLILEDQVQLDAASQIEFAPGDWQMVNTLQAQLLAHVAGDADDRRFVPVIFVGCLRAGNPATGRSSLPLGQTTSIPGGLGPRGTPSAVLIASGDCDADGTSTLPWTPKQGGLLLAHELGHYLGLFHSDHPAGEVLASQDAALMHSAVLERVGSSVARFSAAQGRVLRRHPDVVYVER